MKEIVEKLRNLEREVSREKGPFALFALFLREDALGLWDLVAAAPWIEIDKAEALAYIAKKASQALTRDELTKLSRIVLVDMNNPALDTIAKDIHVEHGLIDIQNSSFFGLPIKQGYIISSTKIPVPA